MSPNGNALLHGLSVEEFARLQPHLHEIDITRGAVLAEARRSADYLYFPVTAVLSLVGTTEIGATVEVALIGREGVASVAAALGSHRLPFRVVAQTDGTVLKIPTEVVTEQLHRCRDLNQRLLMYSHALIAQVAQSAICNRFHTAK